MGKENIAVNAKLNDLGRFDKGYPFKITVKVSVEETIVNTSIPPLHLLRGSLYSSCIEG